MRRHFVLAFVATIAVAVVLPIAAPAARKAQTVNVTLKEFRITGIPATLKAGAVTFNVKNAGKFPHNVKAIFGPAGVNIQTPQLKPGASQTVSATLKPGAYIIICGVGSGYHAAQGMIVHFTVGKFDFTTGKWS